MMFSCKALVILKSVSGDRLVAQYYPTDERLKTRANQLAFEQTLTRKTTKLESDIFSVDKYNVVRQTSVDVNFYVVGAMDENELILQQILQTFVESLSLLFKNSLYLHWKLLFDNVDLVLLVMDEVIDNGVIFETDPRVVVERLYPLNHSDDSILTPQQIVTQVAQKFKKSEPRLTEDKLWAPANL